MWLDRYFHVWYTGWTCHMNFVFLVADVQLFWRSCDIPGLRLQHLFHSPLGVVSMRKTLVVCRLSLGLVVPILGVARQDIKVGWIRRGVDLFNAKFILFLTSLKEFTPVLESCKLGPEPPTFRTVHSWKPWTLDHQAPAGFLSKNVYCWPVQWNYLESFVQVN